MDNSQNKQTAIFNTFTADLQLINDLEQGWSVRNTPKSAFFVKAGYTRMYPNLTIPIGMTIEVQVGGELQVP